MGAVGRTLFGGSEQKQQSTSTPTDMTPPEFQALRGPLAELLMSQVSGGGQQWQGPWSANMTANEGGLLQQLMGQTDPGGTRNQLIEQTMQGGFLGANPFLEQAIQAAQRPTLQGLEETLSRALPGRFTQAGQFVQPQGSSAFDRAAAIATRGAADAMGDIATNMSFGAHEAERGRQQEAIGLSRAEIDSTISNLQAQALPRLIEEMGIERGLQEFQRQTQQLLEIMRILGGVTTPTVAQTSQMTAEGSSTGGIIPGITGLFRG